MFSKCIFCHSDLGSNEIIERFPVGRRLAFDEAKGRLWVVCERCARWNLTPIEERWEAIEDCERRFRGTKLRFSTDHIGLARVSEGLELVRVGKPQRPELAAWRYSAKFQARRMKTLIVSGVLYTALAVAAVANPLQIIQWGIGYLGDDGRSAGRRRRIGLGIKPIARFHDANGEERLLREKQAANAVLLPSRGEQPWGIEVSHSRRYSDAYRGLAQESAEFRGEQAEALISRILPVVNHAGARQSEVRDALGFLDKYETATALFNHAAGIASRIGSQSEGDRGRIINLPPEHRLALEMMSHEDTERRALEGELQLLESAWREAEEIAGISDNLLLPKGIGERLARLKSRR